MRISLLLEREPFGAILEETLPALLVAVTGRRHRVRWDIARRAGGEQLWLCNPRLNAIFRPRPLAAALAPVVRELAWSPRPWRRPLQRAYVTAATRPPTAAWLAPVRVGITPPLSGADALLVTGGNHRVRLLDARAGVVHAIAKAGADPALLRAELAFRAGAGDLPVPPVLRASPAGDWFTEALVPGTPLNRVRDRARREAALVEARAALERLARRTAAAVDAREYVGALASTLERDVASASLLAAHPELPAAVRTLAALAVELGSALGTAETHGDFQDGNVLVDGDGVWLIDWEYTGRRQAAFDPLVHGLAARFPTGLAARVVRAAVDGGDDRLAPLTAWPGIEWTSATARRRALAVFLLEELAVRVRESTGPRVTALAAATRTFIAELDAAARALAAVGWGPAVERRSAA